jgi:hypothetical protein
MPKPLLFISHKQTDSAIAATVANWVRSETKAREIEVEVCWATDVLILIYTAADEDWSYCMRECVAANKRESPGTTTIVFQCGDAVPAVLQGTRTVRVPNPEDLRAFTKQFFTYEKLFPSLKAPLTKELTPEDTNGMARKLEESFTQVQLPGNTPAREWMATGVPPSSGQFAAVSEKATVTTCDALAPALFGLAQITPGARFSDLARRGRTPTGSSRHCGSTRVAGIWP